MYGLTAFYRVVTLHFAIDRRYHTTLHISVPMVYMYIVLWVKNYSLFPSIQLAELQYEEVSLAPRQKLGQVRGRGSGRRQ